ncbi:MAG: outer membrane lipoprotein chaperone LolA [Georgfuchsia sp.]
MRTFLCVLCILCGEGFSPLLFASGLDQLHAYLAASHAAGGDFTQTVFARSGRKPQQSSGSFAFLRPGKFRWAYEKPYAQLLVSDGEKFWSYDQDLNQVTVKKIGQAIGATPAALLAGEALDKNFVLKESDASDGIEYAEATPKAQDATFERIRIGLVDNQPRIMEIYDNFGQVTLLRFTHFISNPDLPAGTFRFVPPRGADVAGE